MRSKHEAIERATIVRVDNVTYEVLTDRLLRKSHKSVTKARHYVQEFVEQHGGYCVVGEAALKEVRARLKA